MRNYEIYREVADYSSDIYTKYIVILYNKSDLLSVERDLVADNYIILEVVNGTIIFCKRLDECEEECYAE